MKNPTLSPPTNLHELKEVLLVPKALLSQSWRIAEKLKW
jgi:hypothetical protein